MSHLGSYAVTYLFMTHIMSCKNIISIEPTASPVFFFCLFSGSSFRLAKENILYMIVLHFQIFTTKLYSSSENLSLCFNLKILTKENEANTVRLIISML